MSGLAHWLGGLSLNNESLEAFREFDPVSGRVGPHGSAREATVFAERVSAMHCLLDVGAHFGFFSMLFASRTGGVAYALEPSPTAFDVLHENAERHPALTILPLRVFAGADRKSVGCRFSVKQAIAGGDEATFSAVPIDALCLRPDCVKIDVEGYEYEVLCGAASTLLEARPLIFLELHPEELRAQGHAAQDVIEMLDSIGYVTTDLDGRALLEMPEANAHVLCVPSG